MRASKIPESVLVVIHAGPQQVLLIRRADMGTWQSVTGSKDATDEPWAQTAAREVMEETGIDVHAPGVQLHDCGWEHTYPIHARYLHRYAPGITHNTEHVFALALPHVLPVRLSPREHTAYQWLPWSEAAHMVFSATNARAIASLLGDADPCRA